MTEILLREALVFGGAMTGAIWGYHLGKLVARRRLASEVSAGLAAVERWTIDVCRGLEGLERSLATTGYFPVTDAPLDHLAAARAALRDAGVRAPSAIDALPPADALALKRFISRVTNRV